MVRPPSKLSSYTSDFQALTDAADGHDLPWLGRLRSEAFSRFEALGFPTSRKGNERWKYTNVNPIARAQFRYSPGTGERPTGLAELSRLAPWSDDWVTLTFVDGRYVESLSRAPGGVNGVLIANLPDAIEARPDVVEKHLGRHAVSEGDAFTALNTAFIGDGAVVYIGTDESPAAPIHLLHVATGGPEPAVSYPRNLIVAESGSRCSVVESYVALSDGAYFTNATTEVVLREGAEVTHYRNLVESTDAYHVGVTRVSQESDSKFKSVSSSRGSALARSEIHANLNGPGSSCDVRGLYLTLGKQHIDNHINIDHPVPNCTSDQYFKGILGGRSRAVYSGSVIVRRGAQKTVAMQKDLNLLLSNGAEIDTKPSLEIYADDVKCGHGATAGAVPEEALFYMMSRGLDRQTARSLLVRGFAAEIIDNVELEPLRDYLDRLFSASIPDIEFDLNE